MPLSYTVVANTDAKGVFCYCKADSTDSIIQAKKAETS